MGLDYEMQLTMSGVLNVCQVVACLWSLWGMDRFGRRKLLLGGGVCMFVSHFIIAVLVGLYNGKWPEHEAAAWTSVSFLLFFMLTFGATWSVDTTWVSTCSIVRRLTHLGALSLGQCQPRCSRLPSEPKAAPKQRCQTGETTLSS
jgi:MFS family permease